MPAMGPTKDSAYRVGAAAATDVLLLLKCKYGVERPREALAKEWDEMEMKLRGLIEEMVRTDHAASILRLRRFYEERVQQT